MIDISKTIPTTIKLYFNNKMLLEYPVKYMESITLGKMVPM